MFPTTITSWALLIARAIDDSDLNSHEIFKQAGLDPEKLSDPNARYSYENMQRLWALVAQNTNDDCFGIKVAQFWHPTSLHALGYAWMASSSLLEALERLVRCLHLVSTAAELQLEEKTDCVLLSFQDTPETGHMTIVADAALAVIVNMCRISYGESFAPLSVSMMREKPSSNNKFEEFFKSPICYSAEKNSLSFSCEDLKKRLPTANAELAQVNDKIVADYIADLDKNNISAQVRIKIIEQLASGNVTEESIAHSLNKSLRSLQRKLAEENISYKILLETTRQQLAKQYVSNSRYSINEVTYLLGFSEPSNFSRAFKRWTGHSPSEYRINH